MHIQEISQGETVYDSTILLQGNNTLVFGRRSTRLVEDREVPVFQSEAVLITMQGGKKRPSLSHAPIPAGVA